MKTSVKAGDRVSWTSHGGTAEGKVVKKLTRPTSIKSHKVAASKDNPEYLGRPMTGSRPRTKRRPRPRFEVPSKIGIRLARSWRHDVSPGTERQAAPGKAAFTA